MVAHAAHKNFAIGAFIIFILMDTLPINVYKYGVVHSKPLI